MSKKDKSGHGDVPGNGKDGVQKNRMEEMGIRLPEVIGAKPEQIVIPDGERGDILGSQRAVVAAKIALADAVCAAAAADGLVSELTKAVRISMDSCTKAIVEAANRHGIDHNDMSKRWNYDVDAFTFVRTV